MSESAGNNLGLSSEVVKNVFEGQVSGAQAQILQNAEIERSRLPVPQDEDAMKAFTVEVESTVFDHDRGLAAFVIRKFSSGMNGSTSAADLVEEHTVYLIGKDGAPPRAVKSIRTHFFPRGRKSLVVTGIDEKGEPVLKETDKV
ncbi:hypothetical protein K2Y00_00270 [Patescibacteria group bacterium]|nr:hypothetical protein [Patescibacteria group bacterium]